MKMLDLDQVRAIQRCLPFTVAVLWLCATHRASVTSWIRSPVRNRDVGGHPQSYHIEGLAADLVCDHIGDNLALIVDARGIGLDAVNEGDHVHVELDYRKNRQ